MRSPASLAITFLLLALPFLTLLVGTAGAQNRGVVNDYLEQVMGSWPADQDIGVLVRFLSAPTIADLGHLELAGLAPQHTFHVVPTVYAVGRPDAVWRASLDSRVTWIEWNRPISYTMENSTATVNATRVWNAVVEDQSVLFPTIDGRGVTVVVVDSGVDAGHPDLENKVILNLKSDSNLVWTQVENSDTSSGHGTHVAGTVAGDGSASAGARRGVAPGAHLIGLSTGEATAIINALGALEWVYDHSRPGDNPDNIRVATNSWGTSGAPYDPNDSIAIVTEKLTYENNVVVTFAAGNAGTNDHDGSTISTNPYSNTPAAVSVAAYNRDGTGVTSFSSRGLASDNATWPDIGAPGLAINSTRARLTLITMEVCLTGLQTGREYQCDPYYMAISGTSMATPHVAGEVALLFQAAPSLRVSDVHADFGSPPNTTADDLQNWYTNPRTRIHEAELILKLTAHLLANGTTSTGGDNFVPQYENWTGYLGLPRDFAQGYGLADMNEAVALALALQKMRSANPDATVLDAYAQWRGLKAMGQPIARDREFEGKTDMLVAGWTGVYSRYNDQFGKPLLIQNTTKYVFIPNGTSEVNIDLTYETFSLQDREAGTVNWQVEMPDGSTRSGSLIGGNGHKTATLSDVQGQSGGVWKFSVVGLGLRLQNFLPPYQFQEVRLRFAFGVSVKLETTAGAQSVLEFVDYHAQFAQWRFLDNGSTGANGSILMTRPVFDLTNVRVTPGGRTVPGGTGGVPWWLVVVVLLALAGLALYMENQRRARAGRPPLPAWVMVGRAAARLRLSPLLARARGLAGRKRGGSLKAALRRPGGAGKGLRGKLPFKRPG